MTMRSLLVLLWVASVPMARGAGEITALQKKGCGVEELKAVVDATRPADVDALDEEGRTALFYSRHFGTLMLLQAGADPNVRDRSGRTAAFRAVSRSGDVAFPIVLDLLLLAHADANARDADGTTLLALAVHEENVPAVKLLLQAGADPTPADVSGDRTPLFFALSQQNDRLASLLRRSAPTGETQDDPDRKLATAATAAQLASVNDALKAGADVNAQDAEGKTALYRAVEARHAEVVALLLLKGANPNLAKRDGGTPLMQCVTKFDMVSERMLVDLILARSDVNATGKNGGTALSEAVSACNNTAAQWMIWRGAKLDVHGPQGTLMQAASLHPDWPSMIELLKRAGLPEESSPKTKERSFALVEAAKAGDLPAIEAQLAQGTPADLPYTYDQTALEWAVCYNRFDVVDLLLRHGANINRQHSYNGEHILHTLAHQTEGGAAAADKIRELVKRGADPNLRQHDGTTPLMVAARAGVTGPNLDAILQVTSDINARDKQGSTALGIARQQGHTATAKLLAAANAVE